LYTEIDRAHDFHQKRGGVNKDQVVFHDDEIHAQAHCMIYNGELYIIGERLRPYYVGKKRDPRISAATAAVYRSLVALPDRSVVPNIEFVIDVADDPGEPVTTDRVAWGYARNIKDETTWILPDHGGWSPFDVKGVGAYPVFLDQLKKSEMPFKDKIPKAVYRGTAHLNIMRQKLVDFTKGKSWADAQHTSADNYLSIHNFCDYQYLFHMEGMWQLAIFRYCAFHI
jgi:hypothetical protein